MILFSLFANNVRCFDRIGKLWDREEPIDPKNENLAASSLDKHDKIIRRNLGMNDEERPMSSFNLNVLTGGRALVQVNQKNE
jgi:hypothetical protein